MLHPWEIAETLLMLTAPDGGSVAFVKCSGGGIGVARDGVPVPACRWTDDQIADCVREFLRLARVRTP